MFRSHRTFASGGGDAIISVWDPLAKKRLRQLPKYVSSIMCMAFSCDGEKLAVGCGWMEEEQQIPGDDAAGGNPADKDRVFVRNVGDECKPKK